MTARAALPLVLGALAALGGCAAPGPADGKSQRVEVRFHLASNDPNSGWTARTDELGNPLYVESQPVLTETDIANAAAFEGSSGYLLRLELTTVGADTLERVTRANQGRRLAVYIDREIAAAPVMRATIAGGQVLIDGGFTKARAQQIADALSRTRANKPFATSAGPQTQTESTPSPAPTTPKTAPRDEKPAKAPRPKRSPPPEQPLEVRRP